MSTTPLEPQSPAWRERAVELARGAGLVGTAERWWPLPSQSEEERRLHVRRWQVPASDGVSAYVITCARASDAATQREFVALQCSCAGGPFLKNCKHIGAALIAEAAELGENVAGAP